MILSFKDRYKNKILNGSKIHTIRKNGDRWTIGKKIHFATGVRTKNYNCFMEGECRGLQKIRIKDGKIWVSERLLDYAESALLAHRDGFNYLQDFYQWFDNDFKGILIHWTDLLY